MIQYAKELGKVLKTFDPDKMRKFIKEHKEVFDPGIVAASANIIENDNYLKGAMAKMVCNRQDMPKAKKRIAKEILKKMNWSEEIWR